MEVRRSQNLVLPNSKWSEKNTTVTESVSLTSFRLNLALAALIKRTGSTGWKSLVGRMLSGN